MVALGSVAGQSRKPVVESRLVPDSIAIGDHFDLEVTVDKDALQYVDFPSFDEGVLTPQIEVLEEHPVDTVSSEGRRVKLMKRYRLTTFDEGVHTIGGVPVLYVDKNITDTLYVRDSMVLQVGTFEIDTLTQTIEDIKPTMNAPLRFGEFSGYLLWGLLALVLIAALVWWIIRRRKNLTFLGKPKPVEPPHVVAIRALEMLHNQKLWQNNKHKQYYTRLTDILREYLEGRYGIHAMEMTSDEILAAVSEVEVAEGPLANLRGLLKTADLVKFAKFEPAGAENEVAYTQTYYFVENTKPTEVEVAAVPDEELLNK
ncbi:hypothetical protein LJC45_05870 [Alistipes sp. OttesenSCG-928-B03]|nr:hypothetical protein [Alistipes sp. OttesenSCG-928-B03]